METNLYMSTDFIKEVKRDLKIQKKANAEIKETLAIERTVFSNQRTLLAYIRTALSLIVAGISIHHFFNSPISMWLAIFLIPTGAVIGFIGFRNFMEKRAYIQRKRDSYIPAKQMLAVLKAEKAAEMKAANDHLLGL